MRARTFVLMVVCVTATPALAQDGGYVRFPTSSPQSCAMACASDKMCASWSFGATARSYGQTQTSSDGSALCTFSGSSVVRNSPGVVSGLPRRDVPAAAAPPMMSVPSPPSTQTSPPQRYRDPSQRTSGATGWDVRPAPWLSNTAGARQSAPPEQPRGMPQILRPSPPLPTPTPSSAPSSSPRIDFEPQAPRAVAMPPPNYAAPVYAPPRALAPVYLPPATPSAPNLSAPPPRPVRTPPAPPGTQEIVARGVPLARRPQPQPSRNPVDEPESLEPAAANVPLSPRPAPARGTPRTTQPVQPSGPSAAAPPRQETGPRPTSGPGAPRPPVRDPSNPESFRGADGMIDAAEMRRAQLNAARENGTQAYSVQREWEAVESERQRAAAAGEVRVDPLAGTSPVPPPPETRAEKRAREAEEAAIAAEEARANGLSDGSQDATPPPPRRPSARGVPRPKVPRQTSESQRRSPAVALDREPKLSGGPG